MKKQMNIIEDGKQTGVRIPKKFVEKFNVTNKDKIEWDDSKEKLKGRLIRDRK